MTSLPIGIDLGTTNSLISVFRDGKPELIPNAMGQFLTPSVVSIEEGEIHVGQVAKERLHTHPKQTAAVFKRSMGTQKKLKLGTKSFSPEELSASVLRKLKADAESYLGTEICDVVVSVPAYFNQTQRLATQNACLLAGLNAKRLINEPTAAALAYGLQDREGESKFLVFDLGGGTFDVTILEHFDGVMEVQASSGDAYLGGEDFTRALAQAIADKLGLMWDKLSTDQHRDLLLLADSQKQNLSSSRELTGEFGAQSFTITREDFDTATQPLLKKLRRPIERCLSDLGQDVFDLDRVILVGGASRMPSIKQLAAKLFRRLPEVAINPDHAVALGAAVQAGLVAEAKGLDDVVMTDVSPFSLGIDTCQYTRDRQLIDGFFSPIIERNTPLPASRERSYYTVDDNQTRLDVGIYQGESPKVDDNIKLGQFSLKVPKNKGGQEGITVRITSDSSGLVEVIGTSISTGEQVTKVITQEAEGLSQSEIAARLKALETYKIPPREEEENRALNARLNRIYEMAKGHERAQVQELVLSFEEALISQDPKIIEAARGEINTLLNHVDDYYVS